MSRPPALARAVLRLLLPRHAIADSIEGDLAEGFAERSARSRTAARWWYRGQVLTLPYLALRREIGRLREREAETEARMRRGGGGWMDGVSMDLRVAVRALLRRPSFSGVAVAMLAISIGAATLLFSAVHGVLLTPLPYERPDELVTVYLTRDDWRTSENEAIRKAWNVYTLTLEHVEAFRAAPGPLQGVAGYTYRRLDLEAGDGAVEPVQAIMVDEGVFGVLGVQPSLGRLPSTDELRRGERVAVLRHEIWTTRFGADPDVLGRSFHLGGDTYTVIGVMPPGFFFPTEHDGDLWTSIADYARTWPSFYGLARLSPGTTLPEATDFFERTARRLGEADVARAGLGGRAVAHLDNVVGNVRGGIELLFGTALLVVLVTCVNLANLFLARAAGRTEELAVRASLGAGTGSLATALLAEAVVVGVVGGVLGVALAATLIGPFVDALGASLRGLPRQDGIGLHQPVLLFSLAATLLTAFVAGVGPAAWAARRDPASGLGSARRSGAGKGTRRSQRLLLSVQAALTVVLVSSAALLARSFLEVISVDMGMNVDRVALLDVEVDMSGRDGLDELWPAQEAMRSRIESIPGVEVAGLSFSVPAAGGVLLLDVRRGGEEAGAGSPVLWVSIADGYFESLGIPVLAGRTLEEEGGAATVEEVVVSESLARQFFDRVDVVGRELSMASPGPSTDATEADRPLRIVGVVGDARQISAFQEPEPTVYRAMRHAGSSSFYVTMAVEGDPRGVLEAASAVAAAMPVPAEVVRATTLRMLLRDGARHIRLRMILMAALAALAGVLAMIGISGVVAHFLSEQTRDVGIRMALGATAPREVGRVVRHALVPTVLGSAVGAAVAHAGSAAMDSFVFGIDVGDPVTYVGVSLTMLATAGVAAWLPARRAAAVDPAKVLNRD